MLKKTIFNIVKDKQLFWFLLVCFFLWMKTFLTQYIEFRLDMNNYKQAFLLFINPLGSIMILVGISLLVKKERFFNVLLFIQVLLSVVLYANVLYYRFYNDFLTVPTLFQTKNLSDLGGSILSLSRPYDILYFVDTIVLFGILQLWQSTQRNIGITKQKTTACFITAVLLIGFTVALAETDRPQLLKRMFDRNYIVKYLGMYNYIIYDIFQSTLSSSQRVLADSDDVTEIIHFSRSVHSEPNPIYFGAAKGLNVIYVHLESLQNFVIDYKLHGEEVTPFLNSMKKDLHTFYFDNFFHQTAQGKTADAEFLIENSLYGLPQGSVFTIKGLNTYQAAPAILGQQGYTSAVFHGNRMSFWNRDTIYKSFGYDHFFDSSYYDMNPYNVEGYGLKDKPFFRQSIEHLKGLPQPFYAKFITLSNHYPYPLSQAEATIQPNVTGDASVDHYFQTARYLDEALEEFFGYLKETGLLSNSVIILYGDHYGISTNHNRAMKEVIGTDITPFQSSQLQRVPLFIRIPGMEGEIQHQYGGQIDLLPTLLHLLGFETKEYLFFGTDLFSEERGEQLVPFRNGNFVSPEITMVNNKFYKTSTGIRLEESDIFTEKEQLVKQRLLFSDRLVNRDLLRFYTPKGFQPVDRQLYEYRRTIQGNVE
jgi:lipoteichoic acid synthase